MMTLRQKQADYEIGPAIKTGIYEEPKDIWITFDLASGSYSVAVQLDSQGNITSYMIGE